MRIDEIAYVIDYRPKYYGKKDEKQSHIINGVNVIDYLKIIEQVNGKSYIRKNEYK